MATMKLIETKTLGTAVSSITFTSIPSTYFDLKILVSARATGAVTRDNILIHLNADTTAANYEWVGAYWYGTSAGTNESPAARQIVGDDPGSTQTASVFSNVEIYVPNYLQTNENHQFASESVVEAFNTSDNFNSYNIVKHVGTGAAITSLTLTQGGAGGTLAVNSTFYLYGISNT
jgi:hypothetical protein